MKPTIEDLWNGNIASAENCGVGEPEIENLAMLMERNRSALEKELDAAQKERFQKYIDCVEEYTCRLSAQAFSDGFCLAGRLLSEVFL